MAFRRLSRAFSSKAKSESSTPLLAIDQKLHDQLGKLDKLDKLDKLSGSGHDIPQKLKKAAERYQLVKQHSQLGKSMKTLRTQRGEYTRILQEMSDKFHATHHTCPCPKHNFQLGLVSKALDEFDCVAASYEKKSYPSEDDFSHKPVVDLLAMEHSRELVILERALADQKSMYHRLTDEDLSNEIRAYKAEQKDMESKCERERQKFLRLREGMRRLPNHCLFRRWFILTHLIEEAIVDCLVDA